MNFMVFEGFLGSGKTLGASIFAYSYHEKSNCALYSNFGLNGSKPFTSFEDFKKIALEPSSILVLDEAHMDLDARSFNTNHVKWWTQVAYYLRKMRCTLIMTSPSFEDLDSRIRKITNILGQVSSDKHNFYYDLYDIQSKRFLKRMIISKEKAFNVTHKIFDTTSMVSPIQIPDDRDQFKLFLEELKTISNRYYHKGEEIAL